MGWRRPLAGLACIATLAACSGNATPGSEAAARGRDVYLGYCVSCHAQDPARDGPLGPAVKGSSEELLRARVLHGTYPPGYTPKRPSAVMQPLPQLESKIPDLAAYLR
jgi:mono/diheme cytochrome c family protein